MDGNREAQRTGSDGAATATRAPRLGYNARETGRGRWLGRAWDPHEFRYKSHTMDTRGDALRWARGEHARLVARVTQSGSSPAVTLLADYLVDKARVVRSAEHLAEITRILEAAIGAGITDLRSDRCTSIATEFLLNARAVHRRSALVEHEDEEDDDEHEWGEASRLAPRTLNRYLNTLSAFGRWAVKRRHILFNPFGVIDRAGVPNELPPTFTLEEMAEAVHPRHSAHPYYLTFCAMAYFGLRQGEAANVRPSWFLWKERMLKVRWMPGRYRLKREKERLVPIAREAAAIFRPLCDAMQLQKRLNDPINPAIVKLHRKTRQMRMNAYLEKECRIPVGDRVQHSARYTWISLMLATGEPEALVQLYAGHDKLETTSEYARAMVQYRRAVTAWERGEIEYQRAA